MNTPAQQDARLCPYCSRQMLGGERACGTCVARLVDDDEAPAPAAAVSARDGHGMSRQDWINEVSTAQRLYEKAAAERDAARSRVEGLEKERVIANDVYLRICQKVGMVASLDGRKDEPAPLAELLAVLERLGWAERERDEARSVSSAWAADMRAAAALCGMTDDEYPLAAVQRVVTQRDEALSSLTAANKVVEDLIGQRDVVIAEMERIRAEYRNQLEGLREGRIPRLMNEKDSAYRQRDAVVSQRDEARAEMDRLMEECAKLRARCEGVEKERDRLKVLLGRVRAYHSPRCDDGEAALCHDIDRALAGASPLLPSPADGGKS